ITARERRPDNSVAGDVRAARAEPCFLRLRVLPGHFVIFAQLRFGIVADDAAREAHHRTPDGAVGRIRADAVDAGDDPHILLRIHLGFWLYPPLVPFAIAVDVEYERRPSLPCLFS